MVQRAAHTFSKKTTDLHLSGAHFFFFCSAANLCVTVDLNACELSCIIELTAVINHNELNESENKCSEKKKKQNNRARVVNFFLIMIYRDIAISCMNCEMLSINYTFNCLLWSHFPSLE